MNYKKAIANLIYASVDYEEKERDVRTLAKIINILDVIKKNMYVEELDGEDAISCDTIYIPHEIELIDLNSYIDLIDLKEFVEDDK